MNIVGTALVGAFLFGSSLTASPVLTPSETVVEPAKPALDAAERTIKELVEDEFGAGHIMVKVAKCESMYRQFNEGTLLRGRENSKDVGIFQINEGYHLAIAAKMGINIYSPEGNIAYARYLYDATGTSPWLASKPCWGK